jgi:hypothetical protein
VAFQAQQQVIVVGGNCKKNLNSNLPPFPKSFLNKKIAYTLKYFFI